jgi:hypothetical protein
MITSATLGGEGLLCHFTMDEMDYSYCPFITPEEINRAWQKFWANCELRYREGERNPDCPKNTYRTDIQRKMPTAKSELKFINEQRRGTKAV